jgi:glycosyltransferase involved in cell wall biosynthesis
VKTVLMITNGFPPLTGGGVLRPSRLAKYLPDCGWHPVVLTMSVSEQTAQFGEPGEKYARDILRPPRFDISKHYRIARQLIRIFGLVKLPFRLYFKSSIAPVSDDAKPRLINNFLVPDNMVLWIPGAILTALWVVWRKKPLAIFSMSPDPSAHLVALVTARLTGIRWVAEFRDPWMTNPFRYKRPFNWMERLESWMEGKVLYESDHVCVTSQEYKKDFLKRYPSLNFEKISYIPNGFDPSDFEALNPHKFDKFTILHAGNFYGARSAILFINAYALLLSNRPDLKSITQVVFVGNIDSSSFIKILDLGIRENIILLGEQTHNETLKLSSGADLLLLIPGPGNGTMPGKLFEYLRSGRPVYCLSTEGPAAALVRQSGGGVVETSANTSEIAESLEKMVYSVQQDRNTFKCSHEILIKYDRREIAYEIAKVLNGEN